MFLVVGVLKVVVDMVVVVVFGTLFPNQNVDQSMASGLGVVEVVMLLVVTVSSGVIIFLYITGICALSMFKDLAKLLNTIWVALLKLEPRFC